VTKSSLPSFRILDVENGATTRAGTISFRLARSIEGSEISRYTVYVNNNKVDVTSSSATFGELSAEQFTVPLYQGKNRVVIVAERARRERPRRCGAAEQRDELATLHSITSSASESNLGGISRPSAFALLRLITSSYLVGA
jgi:hypothetical protein